MARTNQWVGHTRADPGQIEKLSGSDRKHGLEPACLGELLINATIPFFRKMHGDAHTHTVNFAFNFRGFPRLLKRISTIMKP